VNFTTPGQHKSAQAFREHLQSLDADFDCVLELAGPSGALAQPFEHRGRTLANRFCIHPMEGWDGTRSGLPTEHTRRRWRNFGRSGAKLIWGGEAFAVRQDGRANPGQLFLNPDEDTRATLASLRDEVRAGHAEIGEDPDELYIGLQLTHSGRFARPDSELAARIACAHPVLDAKFGIDAEAALLSDSELEAIADLFVESAGHAQAAGFDFVDVKCAHGYLLHDLLGAHTRAGQYGGSFEKRTALLCRIIAGIRAKCPGLEIGVRVSLCDVFPFSPDADHVGEPAGWDAALPYRHGFGVDPDDPRLFEFSEPARLLALLEELDITLINISLGSPYYSPHIQRPAAYPPSDGYLPPEDPLLGVIRHLRVLRQCKAAFPNMVFVGTGYSYLQEYLPHVAEFEVAAGHVDFVGLGRMVLSYPELPRDVLRGATLERKRICRTFSDCTTGPRKGMLSGCFPLDPYYKALPEAARLKEIKKGLR